MASASCCLLALVVMWALSLALLVWGNGNAFGACRWFRCPSSSTGKVAIS